VLIISFREIKPTKTNLIALQKKLIFAKKGEKFLEFKREQLIDLIKSNWNAYQEKMQELIDSLERKDRVGYLINLLQMSRHLERIADHATNIAEEVIYMIEGEIFRHKKDGYQPSDSD